VNSQRLTQGEIDHFDLEITRSNVALSLKFSITTLSSLETGALKQTPAVSRKSDLLMQNSPCSDKVFQSLETSFRFSTLRTSKSTLFGWTKTLTEKFQQVLEEFVVQKAAC
jgi:hypothetical protein